LNELSELWCEFGVVQFKEIQVSLLSMLEIFRCDRMKDSQFWSWTDHWEGWDFMNEEEEDAILLEEWDEELFCELDPCISERNLRIIMICMECGNALDCCICEVSDPTPTPSESLQHPFQ